MADKHEHGNCQHGNEEVLKKIKELPLKDRVKAIAIYHYTQKKANLDLELEKQIKALQKESDILALPIYEQQSQLISGQRAPSSEELKTIDLYFKDTESSLKDQFISNSEPLEGFWGKCITNCDEIKQRFTPDGTSEKDVEVLKYLERIQVILATEGDNFTLKFTFKQNEHFDNTELTKTFHFKDAKDKVEHAHEHEHHHDDAEEDFPFKSVGTEINWKEGKNITKKTIQKKQKNKKSGASRTVNKTVDAESFFNFFRSITFEEKDNLDDEQADDLDAKMEDDYEVGRTIVDEVIPFSLEYFLGINPENEDEDFDDVDDDEEEGDDDAEEDNDTDEDDGKKKGKKGEKVSLYQNQKSNRKKSGDSNKGKKDKGDKDDAGKEGQKADCKQQ